MADANTNSGPGSTGEQGAEITTQETNKEGKRTGLKVKVMGSADQSESGPSDPSEQPNG